jgi:hypothetical protein
LRSALNNVAEDSLDGRGCAAFPIRPLVSRFVGLHLLGVVAWMDPLKLLQLSG